MSLFGIYKFYTDFEVSVLDSKLYTMGVKGLWEFLEPSSKPIPLESLTGKVVAIDISGWIHHAIHATKASNVYLSVLFSRLCKLLFYNIRPIVVFDGSVPELKKNCIKERARKRAESMATAEDCRKKVLYEYMKAHAIETTLEKDVKQRLQKRIPKTLVEQQATEEMYKLPPMTSPLKPDASNSDCESLEEIDDYHYLSNVDIDSAEFLSLPYEAQHEILFELKEATARHTLIKDRKFPDKSDDFSNFQIQNFLKRCDLSSRIEKCRSDMNRNGLAILGPMFMNDETLKIKPMSSEDYTSLLYKISKKSQLKQTTNDNENTVNAGASTSKFVDEINISEESNSPSDTMNQSNVSEEISLTHLEGTTSSDASCLNSPARTKETSSETVTPMTSSALIVRKLNDCQTQELEIQSQVTVQEIENSQVRMNHLQKISHDSEVNVTSSPLKGVCTLQQDSSIALPSQSNDSESDSDGSFIDVADVIPSLSNQISMKSESNLNQQNLWEGEDLGDIEQTAENLQNNIDLYEKQIEMHELRGASLSEEIHSDCKDLLKLLGIPFVVSPYEAEAQCAYLNESKQVDACISDDSDIMLFGCKINYRNFFQQQKFIEQFSMDSIGKIFSLDRKALICLAMMIGSDYTEGIFNIGPVTGIEVLQEFGVDKGFQSILDFRNWWDKQRSNLGRPFTSKVREHLSKLDIPESFPRLDVYEAYLQPTVDLSVKKFQWEIPDVDLVRRFCCSRLHWTESKVNNVLLPVVKRLHALKTQPTLDHCLTLQLPAKTISSKRVRNAISLVKAKHGKKSK